MGKKDNIQQQPKEVNFSVIHEYLKNCKLDCPEDKASENLYKELKKLKGLSGRGRFLLFKKWIEEKAIFDPITLNTLLGLFNRYFDKIKILHMLELHGLIQSNFPDNENDIIMDVVDQRVKRFETITNKSFRRGGAPDLKALDDFFSEYPSRTFIRSITLEQLAFIGKEIPDNNINKHIYFELINWYIDKLFRNILTKITGSDVKTDIIINDTQKRIEYFLSQFDPDQKFTVFMGYAIKNKAYDQKYNQWEKSNIELTDNDINKDDYSWVHDLSEEAFFDHSEHEPLHNDHSVPDAAEQDLFVASLFITVSGVVFNLVSRKPHQKLIFVHGMMFYQGKEKNDGKIKLRIRKKGGERGHISDTNKSFQHKLFIDENFSRTLQMIWEITTVGLKANIEYLDEFKVKPYFPDDREFTGSLFNFFKPFENDLNTGFNKIYSESSYFNMRQALENKLVGDIFLRNFFPEPENYFKVQKAIAQWNFWIKNELRDYFAGL